MSTLNMQVICSAVLVALCKQFDLSPETSERVVWQFYLARGCVDTHVIMQALRETRVPSDSKPVDDAEWAEFVPTYRASLEKLFNAVEIRIVVPTKPPQEGVYARMKCLSDAIETSNTQLDGRGNLTIMVDSQNKSTFSHLVENPNTCAGMAMCDSTEGGQSSMTVGFNKYGGIWFVNPDPMVPLYTTLLNTIKLSAEEFSAIRTTDHARAVEALIAALPK